MPGVFLAHKYVGFAKEPLDFSLATGNGSPQELSIENLDDVYGPDDDFLPSVSGGSFSFRLTGTNDGTTGDVDGAIGTLVVSVPNDTEEQFDTAYGSLGFGRDELPQRWIGFEPTPDHRITNATGSDFIETL